MDRGHSDIVFVVESHGDMLLWIFGYVGVSLEETVNGRVDPAQDPELTLLLRFQWQEA